MTESNMTEELRLVRANLEEANREIARLRQENAELTLKADAASENAQSAFSQLQMMRNTLTWQATAPIRVLLDKLRV